MITTSRRLEIPFLCHLGMAGRKNKRILGELALMSPENRALCGATKASTKSTSPQSFRMKKSNSEPVERSSDCVLISTKVEQLVLQHSSPFSARRRATAARKRKRNALDIRHKRAKKILKVRILRVHCCIQTNTLLH